MIGQPHDRTVDEVVVTGEEVPVSIAVVLPGPADPAVDRDRHLIRRMAGELLRGASAGREVVEAVVQIPVPVAIVLPDHVARRDDRVPLSPGIRGDPTLGAVALAVPAEVDLPVPVPVVLPRDEASVDRRVLL